VVGYSACPPDNPIRHPTFIALRTDKPAKSIRRQSAAVPPARARSRAKAPAGAASRLVRGRGATRAGQEEVAGVRLTNPDRVYFPELGITKLELARYYEAMADRILPGLAQRPLSLVRCPEGRTGKCFYQKHVGKSVPESVGRVVIEKGESPYAMVVDLPSLIALVQISVIEFHVWGSRADQIEKPDQIVIDLDPDEAVPWRRLVEAARLVRALLGELELVPFLRTTGGKGLHVVAPLVRRTTWESVKGFTHAIALRLAREKPEEYTDRISKARRKGRILIDYLRNQRDATAIASYSVRARPNAPVSIPLAWDELERAKKMPQWNVRNATDRLALPDPWKDFESSRRVLTTRARRRIESG
jgi:bifunctional non-homologous end joining protein LigD